MLSYRGSGRIIQKVRPGLWTARTSCPWRSDKLEHMFPRTGGFERCTSPGCTRKHHAGGLCQGHAAAGWRGQPLRPLGSEGRWVDPKGYVFIRCPDPHHPNAKSTPGWIAEHVRVMSQVLGRPLRKGESVHHRNNIKHDNRPENLQLWHTHQPKGASVKETVRWVPRAVREGVPEMTSEG